MKRLLLGLMLLMTATAASAEWTLNNVTTQFIVYVDKSTIRRSNNLSTMWDLRDFKSVQKFSGNGQQFYSVKTFMEYDCKEKKNKVLQLTIFSGQTGSGDVVFSRTNVSDQGSHIEPRSIAESQWIVACGKK